MKIIHSLLSGLIISIDIEPAVTSHPVALRWRFIIGTSAYIS